MHRFSRFLPGISDWLTKILYHKLCLWSNIGERPCKMGFLPPIVKPGSDCPFILASAIPVWKSASGNSFWNAAPFLGRPIRSAQSPTTFGVSPPAFNNPSPKFQNGYLFYRYSEFLNPMYFPCFSSVKGLKMRELIIANGFSQLDQVCIGKLLVILELFPCHLLRPTIKSTPLAHFGVQTRFKTLVLSQTIILGFFQKPSTTWTHIITLQVVSRPPNPKKLQLRLSNQSKDSLSFW